MRLQQHQLVYVRSMGKLLRVTAVFHDEDEANKYMEKHADEGLVACFAPYFLIANVYDKGEEISA